MRVLRLLLIIAVVNSVSSCGVPTESQRTESRPLLSALAFTDTAPASTQALEVIAVLANGERLPDSTFLRLEITTADAGQPRVYWAEDRVCGDSTPIVCDRLIVRLKPGLPLSVLQPVLESLGAQLVLMWSISDSEVGSVQFFGAELDEARTRLESDPSVERVTNVDIFQLAGSPQQVARAVVPTASWIDDAIMLASGTRVTATYRQPDGSLIQAAAIIE